MSQAGPTVSERVADLGTRPLGYRVFQPSQPTGIPLVLIHGAGRAAAAQLRAFLPAAVRLGVPLLCPTFDREHYGSFHRLGGAHGRYAARDALLDLLDDAQRVFGVDTSLVDIAGYSAGAQFAHRFAMTSPTRVNRVVVAAAGWYTYLDDSRAFPFGTQGIADECGDDPPLDPSALLEHPTLVLVGEHDTERDADLRTSVRLDRVQGPNRLIRALAWADHLDDQATCRGVPRLVRFELLPDTGHGFAEAVRHGGLVGRVMAHVRPELTDTATERSRP